MVNKKDITINDIVRGELVTKEQLSDIGLKYVTNYVDLQIYKNHEFSYIMLVDKDKNYRLHMFYTNEVKK